MADGLRMARDTQSISHDFPENSLQLNGTRAGLHPPVNVTPSQTRASTQDMPPATRPRDRSALMSNFQERPLPRNISAHAHQHAAPTGSAHPPPVPTHTFSHAGPTHAHPQGAPINGHLHATLTHPQTHASSMNGHLHAAPAHAPTVPSRTFSNAGPAHTHSHTAPMNGHLHAVPGRGPAGSMHTHSHTAQTHAYSNAPPTHPHSHTTAHSQHVHPSSMDHTRHNAAHVPHAVHQRANTCLMVDPGARPAMDTYVPPGPGHNGPTGGSSSVGAAVHHLASSAPSHHFQQHSTHIVPRSMEFVQQQQHQQQRTQNSMSHGGGAPLSGVDQRRHPAVPTIPSMRYSNQPPARQMTSADGLPINTCPLPPDPGMASPIANDRLHRA